METITEKKFWEARHKLDTEKQFGDYRIAADRVLQNFLAYNPNLSLLEVGCVPGRIMTYFVKNFGYQVSGVDYSDEIQSIGPILKANGIDEFELFHEDFLRFNPPSRYDIVFSGGFVEHFSEPELVFKKHCDLLKSQGLLIISLPNFHYGQKMLRVLFGLKREFQSHNLDVMFPQVWGNLAKKEGFSILYCDYIVTFGFYLPTDYNPVLKHWIGRMTRLFTRGLDILNLSQIPNCYFSPHILLVARKP